MIPRDLENVLRKAAATFKAVTLIGPRQSGKTTLARMAFPDRPYVSLENPDVQRLAETDPRALLARHRDGCILDEVQRAARILGIERPEQLNTHPLRGALFENFVVSELLKARYHRGKPANLFFWRDNLGLEVVVLAESGGRLHPVEIKSGATLADDWFRSLERWMELAGKAAASPRLVYGGDEAWKRGGVDIVPWRSVSAVANLL